MMWFINPLLTKEISDDDDVIFWTFIEVRYECIYIVSLDIL